MEIALANGPLYGRPRGGVATLIHKSYQEFIINHMCSEKFNIISIGSLMLINVYLPSNLKKSELDAVVDIFEDIKCILEPLNFQYLIIGGDLNCDPSNNTALSKLIQSYMNDLNLELCTSRLDICNNKVNHTFIQEKLGHFSTIDHFYTTRCSKNYVMSAETIEHFCNFRIIYLC